MTLNILPNSEQGRSAFISFCPYLRKCENLSNDSFLPFYHFYFLLFHCAASYNFWWSYYYYCNSRTKAKYRFKYKRAEKKFLKKVHDAYAHAQNKCMIICFRSRKAALYRFKMSSEKIETFSVADRQRLVSVFLFFFCFCLHLSMFIRCNSPNSFNVFHSFFCLALPTNYLWTQWREAKTKQKLYYVSYLTEFVLFIIFFFHPWCWSIVSMRIYITCLPAYFYKLLFFSISLSLICHNSHFQKNKNYSPNWTRVINDSFKKNNQKCGLILWIISFFLIFFFFFWFNNWLSLFSCKCRFILLTYSWMGEFCEITFFPSCICVHWLKCNEMWISNIFLLNS